MGILCSSLFEAWYKIVFCLNNMRHLPAQPLLQNFTNQRSFLYRICHLNFPNKLFVFQNLADLIEGAALIETIPLTPTSCRKGDKIAVDYPQILRSYPHALIEPAHQSEFDFPYLCDSVTDGGGWIVIQRRTNGNTNFYRGWEDYKNGFGEMDGDFWLGNEKISTITRTGRWELKVTIKNGAGAGEANYRVFSVDPESSGYTLIVGGYVGNTGDSLSTLNGQAFSSPDHDNDSNDSGSCAAQSKSGFWFNSCGQANLNGPWGDGNGMRWKTFDGTLNFTEMKIRQVYAYCSK